MGIGLEAFQATAAITANTTPLMGYANRYNASAAARTPVLPALSGQAVGGWTIVEKDSLDVSGNTVTLNCAGSDTFHDGTTSVVLNRPDAQIMVMVVSVGGTKFWKRFFGGSGGGTGDASTNTTVSADGEVALYSGTGGKTLKRATGSGIPKLTAGVQSIAAAGTDYVLPGGSVATLTTPRLIDGQSFNGSADVTVIAPGTHGATGKTTPVDADEFPLVDTAASNLLKKLTFANLKAAVKAYYDTVATTMTSKTLANPTITGYTETFNPLGTVGAAATLSLASGTLLSATLTPSTPCVFTMPAVGAGKSFTLLLNQAGGSPPAFDNSAVSAHQINLASGTLFSFTQAASTAGAAAIVVIYNSDTVLTTAATCVVTFGGVAMTDLGAIYAQAGSPLQGHARVFYLANIGAGGGKTVNVTITESGHVFTGNVVSYTYTGVASIGTLQTANGNSATASVTVPSAVGNRVFGAVMNNSGDTFSAFTLTARQTNNNTSVYPQYTSGDTGGASSVAVTAAKTAPFYWLALGLNLIGAGATTAAFSGVVWPTGGAPAITPTAGATDILTFVSDGIDWFGSASQGYI